MRARVLRALRRRAVFLSMISLYLFFLGFFDHNHFVGIAHTLAFIRLRLTISAHISGHLTNLLPINTLNQNLRLASAFQP